MDADLAKGSIGAVGSYDVAFSGGKLTATAVVGKDGVSDSNTFSIDSDVVLDAIAAAIPGKIDDALIGVIKAALKA